ncbi:MAG: hypothetical protein WCD76_14240, partial [Pyrinomonadaceae bacterium]
MSRRMLNLAGGVALAFAASTGVLAQEPTQTTTTTQTTQTVQNADGTWTVIQYPANKEVTVDFTPGATYSTAKGRARIMRMADHTMINLDLSGLPADAKNFNLYAVDPSGNLTLLGPVNVANGIATQTFNTPLDKFMLTLSPDATLTTYAPETAWAFRSAAPQGLA